MSLKQLQSGSVLFIVIGNLARPCFVRLPLPYISLPGADFLEYPHSYNRTLQDVSSSSVALEIQLGRRADRTWTQLHVQQCQFEIHLTEAMGMGEPTEQHFQSSHCRQ